MTEAFHLRLLGTTNTLLETFVIKCAHAWHVGGGVVKVSCQRTFGGSARHDAFASKCSSARKSEQFTHGSSKGKTYVKGKVIGYK